MDSLYIILIYLFRWIWLVGPLAMPRESSSPQAKSICMQYEGLIILQEYPFKGCGEGFIVKHLDLEVFNSF